MRDKSLWKKNQGQPTLSTSLYEITTAINHFCSRFFFTACDVNYHYREIVRSWLWSWRNTVRKTIAALSLFDDTVHFWLIDQNRLRRLRNQVKASSLNVCKNLAKFASRRRNRRRRVKKASSRVRNVGRIVKQTHDRDSKFLVALVWFSKDVFT